MQADSSNCRCQPAGQSASFSASRRLKQARAFAAVFARGKVASDANLVIHALRADAATTRLGLSVSKRVGHAPQRNRWKRLIREAFRKNHHRLPDHLWLVVRPRRGAQPQLAAIEQSLNRLVQRLDRKL